MRTIAPVAACPCGSLQPYASCCGPIHAGSNAPTAERLMRARYTAFVLGDEEFIRSSWASETCPRDLDIAENGEPFNRLVILDTARGGLLDSTGEVAFEAHYTNGVQRERSRFVRRNGQWLYLDGTLRF